MQKVRDNEISQMSNLKNEIIGLNNKIIELSHINKLSVERLAFKEHIIEENVKTISNLELKLKNSLKANEEVDKKKIKYDFNEISFKANTQIILNDTLKQNASQLQILLDKANKDKENMENTIKELKFNNEQKLVIITSLELDNLQKKNEIAMKISQNEILKINLDKLTGEKTLIESQYIESKLKYEAEVEKNSCLEKEKEDFAQIIKDVNKARNEVEVQYQEAEKRFITTFLIFQIIILESTF